MYFKYNKLFSNDSKSLDLSWQYIYIVIIYKFLEKSFQLCNLNVIKYKIYSLKITRVCSWLIVNVFDIFSFWKMFQFFLDS